MIKIILAIISFSQIFASSPKYTTDSNGEIIEKHFLIDLDSSQLESVNRFRKFKLTKSQRDLFSANNFETEDTLYVINNKYHSCTCNDNVGIWYKINKIAILMKEVHAWNQMFYFKKNTPIHEYYKETYSYFVKQSYLVSSNFSVFKNGKFISFKELQAIQGEILIETPPNYSGLAMKIFRSRLGLNNKTLVTF